MRIFFLCVEWENAKLCKQTNNKVIIFEHRVDWSRLISKFTLLPWNLTNPSSIIVPHITKLCEVPDKEEWYLKQTERPAFFSNVIFARFSIQFVK
jgi:hypothetical protein